MNRESEPLKRILLPAMLIALAVLTTSCTTTTPVATPRVNPCPVNNDIKPAKTKVGVLDALGDFLLDLIREVEQSREERRIRTACEVNYYGDENDSNTLQ